MGMNLPEDILKKAEEFADKLFCTYEAGCFVKGAEWMYIQSRAFMHLETEKELAETKAKLVAAEAEIQCLRSVLSEWDEDKSCYTQMIAADELARKRK